MVTEGFAGNIALKTAEGTARQLGRYPQQRDEPHVARQARLPACARGAFARSRDKMDPRKSNGGVFLGLNGIVIKSHGGTDAEGFASAVDLGYDMVRHDLLAKIGQIAAPAHRRTTPIRRAGGSSLVTMLRSVVLGCGSYLPSRVLTNDDLARMVDTSDEWIVQRTGIRERHIARRRRDHVRPGTAGGARRAGRMPASTPQSIDLIVLATSTPDNTFPASAVVGAGRARHHPRRRLRSAGRVLGLRLSRSPTADGLLRDRRASSARW